MDPISKLVRSLRISRQKVQDRRPGASRTSAEQAEDAPHGTASARADLARRIRAVDPKAHDARDACVKMLIEHMLAREFGAAIMNSPAMQQTVRDVQRVMDSDPAIRSELDSLIGSLRQEG